MNFEFPIQVIGDVDTNILTLVNNKLIDYESKSQYIFQYQNWSRLDSYNNPENLKLEDIIGDDIVNRVMSYFQNEVLYGWSLSYLPGNTKIADHVDRMMLHRLAKRIIVPVSNTPDVLNWHYSPDKISKRFYTLDYGKIYRLNTAATHGLVNNSKEPRRAVYFDIMPTRLFEKFKDSFDIQKVILLNSTGEIHVL
jgi:hypothetical protein